jgi:hypothetical protein
LLAENKYLITGITNYKSLLKITNHFPHTPSTHLPPQKKIKRNGTSKGAKKKRRGRRNRNYKIYRGI